MVDCRGLLGGESQLVLLVGFGIFVENVLKTILVYNLRDFFDVIDHCDVIKRTRRFLTSSPKRDTDLEDKDNI